MANRGKFQYGIEFNVNKTSLTEIVNSLTQIQKMTADNLVDLNKGMSLGDAVTNLKEIKDVASQVQRALKNAYNTQLDSVNLKTFNKELEKSGLTIESIYKKFSLADQAGQNAFRNLSSGLLTTNMALKESNTLLDKMAKTMGNTIKWGISSSIFNNITSSIQKAYNYTIKLDKSLNDIRVVSDASASDMERFARYANEAAKNLGASTLDYTQGALIYYQQGLDEEQVKQRTDITLKMANVLETSAEEVSDYMTAIWNNFADGSKNLEYFADVLAELGAKTASSAEEISTGLEKFASIGKTIGLSYEYAAASLATITATTRQSADVVGTALRTIFSRIQGLNLGETLDDGTTLNKYSSALEAVGISIKDQNGSLKDMNIILDEMGSKWGTLSRDQQVALSQTVAGVRQYTQLMSLMNNWDFFKENVEAASESTGALQKQQEIYMESAEAHLEQMRASFEGLYDSIFDEDSIKNVADIITRIVENLSSFVQAIDGGGNALLMLGSTAMRVFDVQIARGLATTISNLRKVKQNFSELEAQAALTKVLEGLKIDDSVLNILVGMKKEVLDLGEIVSAEQHNTANDLIRIRNEIENNRIAWEESLEAASEYLQRVSNGSIESDMDFLKNIDQDQYIELETAIDSVEEEARDSIKTINDLQKAITKLVIAETDYNNDVNSEDKHKAHSDALKTVTKETDIFKNKVTQLLESEQLAEKESIKLTTALNDYNNAVKAGDGSEDIALQRLLDVFEQVNKKIISDGENTKNILKQQLDGIGNDYQRAVDEAAQKWDDFVKQLKVASVIQQMSNLIGAVGQVASAIQSLANISDIWNNDDLSSGEKFLQIMIALGTAVPMLVSSVGMLGKSLFSLIPSLSGVTAATAGTTAATGAAAAGATTMWTAFLGPIALIIAGVAAVGVAIYALVKAQNKEEDALKAAEEHARNLKEQYTEVKNAYDNLKKSLEDYKGALNALDKLKKGTQEWKEAIIDINSQVLDLMEKYPELVEMGAISTNSDGMLSISDEGWDQLLDDQLRKVQNTQGLVISSNINVADKQLAVELKELKETLDNDIIDNLNDKELKNLSRKVEENSAVLQNSNASLSDFKDSLDDYVDLSDYDDEVIKELQESLNKNRNSVNSFNTSMDNYTIKVGEYTQQLIKAANSNNDDYLNSDHQSYIDQEVQSKYDTTKAEVEKELENYDFLDIASIWDSYFGGNGDYLKFSKYQELTKDSFQYQDKNGAWRQKDWQEAYQEVLDQYVKENLEIETDDTIKTLNKDIKLANLYYGNFSGGMTKREEGVNEEGNRYEVLSPTYKTDVGDYIADVLSLSEEELLQKYSKESLALYSKILEKGNEILIEDGVIDSYFKDFDVTKALELTQSAEGKAIDEKTLKRQQRRDFGNSKGTAITTSANALIAGIQDGSITEDNIEANENYKILANQLEKIKELYPEVGAAANELSKTWNVGTQGYIEALEIIQDKVHNAKMTDLVDDQKEAYENVKDFIEETEDGEIKIFANTEGFDNAINDLINKDYAIDVEIHAEAEQEFESIVNAMEDIDAKASLIGEDFVVSANKIRELNNAFPGIIQNMEDVGDGSVRLNKQVVESAIDSAQAEVAADSEATIIKLQNQASLLRKKQAIYTQMAEAAMILAQGDVENEEAASEAKAAISSGLAELEMLNEQTTEEYSKESAKAIADDVYTNSAIVANNWKSAYQSAAADSYAFAKAAIQNNAAAVGNGSATKGTFGSVYKGGTKGSTSESTAIKETQELLNSTAGSEGTQQKWANIAQIYQQLATNAGRSANDIEGMIAEIGARNIDLGDRFGNISSGKGSKSDSKSESEAKFIEKLEDELDIYHDIDIVLKNISNDLNKLEKQQDKLFGKNYLDNLNQQLELLDKQINATNEKIKIAQEEAAKLKSGLAQQGVQFNSDGTISNYESAFNTQKGIVDKLINQYNNLSASEQEKWDEQGIIDNAKARFEKFKENLDRYDELITDFIPGLEEDAQEAIDRQIEIDIEKFNYEIKIRLDMSEAERDWNQFLADIGKNSDLSDSLEGDIVRNLQARRADIDSYFKTDGTGSIQKQTEHLNNVLEELRKMDNGESNVYGDDRNAALEDLKTYYDGLKDDLKDVVQLQKDAHQAFMDMADEAQEKFDEQVETFEQITSLVEHDMKLIELINGDEAYDKMARYYDIQQNNYNKQLDFQRQQVEFWEQQMNSLEEGSDEWDAAKDAWTDALNEWQSLVESSIENIKEKFENAINNIFKNLNDRITDGLGLDFVSEQWDLINKNAEQYLDSINAAQGIRDIEKKYLDAIEKTDSLGAQKKLNNLMEEELEGLRSKDKLTQYDIERAEKKYQLTLAQIALEEAQQNKNAMRLRRDSQGNYTYQFVADDDEVAAAQDELDKQYNSLYNFDKEAYISNLDSIYATWDEYQQKMYEASLINDPEQRLQKELLLQQEYGELITGLVAQNEELKMNIQESAFMDLANLYQMSEEDFFNMTQAEKDMLMKDLVPQWDSAVQTMAEKFSGPGGFTEQTKQALEEIQAATEELDKDLEQVGETSGANIEQISNGFDENLPKLEQLLTDNETLINQYDIELQKVKDVISEVDKLYEAYKKAKDEAIAATQAAYNYQQQSNSDAANAAAGQNQGGTPSGSGNGGNQGSGSGSGSGSQGGNTGGGSGSGKSGGFRLGGVVYVIKSGDTLSGIARSKYGSASLWPEIYNNNKSVIGSNPDLIYPGTKIKLATGGYTGNWPGTGGRLAELHKKELVLNAKDTENMLSAVHIMRHITDTIGTSMLERLATLSGGIGTPMSSINSAQEIEQNVHIEASFPNATSSKEIEDAFNNLVNIASQRALKTRK